MDSIPFRMIDPVGMTPADYDYTAVTIIIVMPDGQLLLQMRDGGAPSFPYHVGTFGGAIDEGETPLKTVHRELMEELGAVVNDVDLTALGAVYGSAPGSNRGRELQHVYVWRAPEGAVTGCYEGAPITFANVEAVLAFDKVMPALRAVMEWCQQQDVLA